LQPDEKALLESLWRRHTVKIKLQQRRGRKTKIDEKTVSEPATKEVGALAEQSLMAIQRETPEQQVKRQKEPTWQQTIGGNLHKPAEGSAVTEGDNGAGALGGNGRETAANGPEDVVVVTTTHTAADVPLVASSSTQPRGAASENAVTPDSAKSVDQEQKKSTSLSSILSYFKRKGAPPGPPPPGGTTPGQ